MIKMKSNETKILPDTKPKKVRLRVGDPDFVPPDGGWGWLVVLACGFSNLSTFTMSQQFGLVFRDKFEELKITNAEMTTITNLNSAFNACVGLINGPIFRKFSYRKVAFFGALIVVASIFITTFCQSFWTYVIFYGICYGSGMGINQSANALALNTFFITKRRIATGLSWSATGLGPIIWPYVITALIGQYQMEGTLLIFSAFAGHAIVCSLLLQPVHWHTKFKEDDVVDDVALINPTSLDKIAEPETTGAKTRKTSFFSSQYLYNVDDSIHLGYEMSDTGTPRIIHGNDGWFSQNKYLAASKLSLASNKTGAANSRVASGYNSRSISARPSYNNLNDARYKKYSLNLALDLKERMRKVEESENLKGQTLSARPSYNNLNEARIRTKSLNLDLKERMRNTSSQNLAIKECDLEEVESDCSEPISSRPSYNNLNDARKKRNPLNLSLELKDRMRKVSYKKPAIDECDGEDSPLEKAPQDLKEEEKLLISQILLQPSQQDERELLDTAAKILNEYVENEEEKKFSFCQKVAIFFDLDLLKDKIYLNIMLGITIANFAELNFSNLTPFILKEFGFQNFEIATFMSLLAAIDIVVRFFIPFIADKLGWDNRTFFLIGIVIMALGRIVLVHTQAFSVSLGVAVMIGFGKGLRTIFIALVIPSHVPLERLPGASGLHLVTSGLVFLLLGPVIGWVRDAVNDYVVTLHLLNIMTYITVIAWLIESVLEKRRAKKGDNLTIADKL